MDGAAEGARGRRARGGPYGCTRQKARAEVSAGWRKESRERGGSQNISHDRDAARGLTRRARTSFALTRVCAKEGRRRVDLDVTLTHRAPRASSFRRACIIHCEAHSPVIGDARMLSCTLHVCAMHRMAELSRACSTIARTRWACRVEHAARSDSMCRCARQCALMCAELARSVTHLRVAATAEMRSERNVSG